MPPPGYEPFLKMICENPADDAPRLVYADWLEENGEELRAVFIRAQIAVACGEVNFDDLPKDWCRPYEQVFAIANRDWRKELPNLSGVSWGQFYRGFICAADFNMPKWFFKRYAAAFEVAPIQSLRISYMRSHHMERLASIERLNQLEGLTLAARDIALEELGWDVLARSPYVANLKWIRVEDQEYRKTFYRYTQAISLGGASIIASSATFANLQSLQVRGILRDETLSLLERRFGKAFTYDPG
jgi:uncharacterized protein (TIGR02996 family)